MDTVDGFREALPGDATPRAVAVREDGLRGVVTRSWWVELGMRPPQDLEDDGRLLDRLLPTIARLQENREHPWGWS